MAQSTKVNDKVILDLKKQVDAKRAEIKKSAKFTPVTNCSIEFNGTRCNIQAVPKEGLVNMLVILNSYKKSAEELDLLDSCIISGFKLTDWITDLKAKLANITRKEEENKLNAMERKLESLLSDGKKVELELQDIANNLVKF